MDKNLGKQQIQNLIEKYQLVVKQGKVKDYTEEETKKDFILPLFRALGWNVEDKNEVSAEEHIISSGRVDYGFYINERAKFYLEAKPLKADINIEDFAKQAIRYSFNKGVTWAILTDFESVKIFNAQSPSQYLGDKLYFEIKWQEYLERFDKLWELSKESFLEDLIDKEAEKVGKKLQRVPITETLAQDLEKSREILANDLSKWNDNLSKDILDEGVQKILDRLIFLRVVEDRGIESSILKSMVNQWESGGKRTTLYKSMVSKFRELDEYYNSSLFSKDVSEDWDEYSDAVKRVIRILYGKEGYYDYDFSVMPADVLGNVYENYLGYKLSQSKKGLTVNKAAGKRKEQGIYYTPAFIVDYIVRNALNPVLDKCRDVDDLKKIKVLDPACGSGSFLIKALEVILEKYKDFNYTDDQNLRIQIVLENLYGVDLDEQAVEIARLNLLINSLEERAKLPSLDKNIKNGNSLISGLDEELRKYFGKNFRDKKPFNWKEEFPGVFKQGGFNVIIGNPPYIFARGGNFDEQEKKYYYDNFKLQKYQINTYLLFIDQAYKLLKENGFFGFIVPNNWLTINTFSELRKFILKETGGVEIINAVDSIFSQASVDNCILIFKKTKPSTVKLGELIDGNITALNSYNAEEFYKNDFVINIQRHVSVKENSLIDKINKASILLGKDVATVSTGIKAYQTGKGKPVQTDEVKTLRKYHSREKIDDTYIPYLNGVDVQRYLINWSGDYLSYGDWLAEPRKSVSFDRMRILVRQIPSKLPYSINASVIEEQYINDINSMVIFNFPEKYIPKYVLGIINSKLISYWFNYTFNKFQRKIFPQFKVNELAQFPVYPANRNQQKVIERLVEKILSLKNNLRSTETNSNKWNGMKLEVEKTDKKIDEEVYRLYELTPEEIKIVENSLN